MKYMCDNCKSGHYDKKTDTCYCDLYKKDFPYDDYCKSWKDEDENR